MRPCPASLLVALALTIGTGAVAAQSTATAGQYTVTLDGVEKLIQAGKTEDARDLLLRWWGQDRPTASTRDVQRGLWLRGRLTVDPAQAELDYRRLVVEYPGGPYSAEALFRLAQSAWAAGDSSMAAQHVARLSREYPGSRVRVDAEAWLAGAGSPPPRPVASTDTAEDSSRRPPSAAAPVPRPAAVADTARFPTSGAAPASSGRYAVQLGAFSSEARARALQSRARDAGFETRVIRVPGSRLIRVRVGRFASSEAADPVMKRLEAHGFTAAVVPDADREEPVGS